jgi:hyperpolarization activated cyclic nucleotide-gated potassium channel 2
MKLTWDMLCMILIFYEIITIPFKISFNVDISDTWDTIVDTIFFMDIALSFNTAYYKDGIPIYSRKKIAINYLKLWFWLDLMASFPHEEVK